MDSDYRGVLTFPPGHCHSPLFTPQDFHSREESYLDSRGEFWRNVDLRTEDQLRLLREMLSITSAPDFPRAQSPSFRYYSENVFFGYESAFVLSAMMLLYRPRRIIEVGSGFSSAVMLDTCQHCQLPVQLTFIEPFADRLRSLLRDADRSSVQLIEKPVQDVETTLFEGLEANDLLFIDSSHVAKVGSDVVDLFFRIIPRLKVGCIVHLHDIFYPGTYPRNWVAQGIAWNETFLLRAFLLFNSSFRIVFFNSFAQKEFREVLTRSHPRLAENESSSLWLQRIA